MYEVQVRHVGEQKVLSIERRTLVDKLGEVIPENVDRLVAHAARAGIETPGTLFPERSV